MHAKVLRLGGGAGSQLQYVPHFCLSFYANGSPRRKTYQFPEEETLPLDELFFFSA